MPVGEEEGCFLALRGIGVRAEASGRPELASDRTAASRRHTRRHSNTVQCCVSPGDAAVDILVGPSPPPPTVCFTTTNDLSLLARTPAGLSLRLMDTVHGPVTEFTIHKFSPRNRNTVHD